MAELKWWQKAVFYQIYPRSFADGNGDGISDFPGMTAKLDYLRELGVDALWLSPHYPSPFIDCGYDISDYTGVAAEYGTLEDFKTFLAEAHARDIRVILDMVLNHTSDQHPWFIESRSSRNNPKRDWFVWHDGNNGAPPNNWMAIFGGSAWELDETTGQYYYHMFLKEQPDLNWRNPDVKAAMWDALRFWLDLGVDGFRLDAVGTIYEDPDLPNHTATIQSEEIMSVWRDSLSDEDGAQAMEQLNLLVVHQMDQPGLHALMKELRALIDEYPGDRVLVGENEDVTYHGSGDDELHLLFNFPLMHVPRLTPERIRANQAQRLLELPEGAWPCNTLGNHDNPRMWSRYGDGVHNDELSRLHTALMLTLKGTPFLYNGEEIGMADLELTDPNQLRDMAAAVMYDRMVASGTAEEVAMGIAAATTRDRCRSPMQWSAAPNAGFSPAGVQTWLPVNPNYAAGVNVADQQNDPGSMLNVYRQLLNLRRTTPALVAGDYHALHASAVSYLAFTRHDVASEQTVLVVLNFSAVAQRAVFDLPTNQLRLLYSSVARADRSPTPESMTFAPFEIFIAELV